MKQAVMRVVATMVVVVASSAAWAGPKCDTPQEKWMKEDDFRKKVEAQGYDIKTFKVSSGKCYEIYGFDKSGKKVEIYFDPASAAVLETK